MFTSFLSPLKKFAFKIDIGILQFVKVDMDTENVVDDDVLREKEASVEIDGTHQRLKNIASQRLETIARLGIFVLVFDVVVETKFLCQFVERCATDNARAHFCKKTFGLSGIGTEKVVTHDKFNHCITQVFQPFVAEMVVAYTFFRLRLVRKSQLI